ncbi:MAG TPA: hypothetical protein VMY16_11415 [Ilumatobacteraceae bacterium]|nr:hypothetical protein [Ilumatobacteraceae bacterium]
MAKRQETPTKHKRDRFDELESHVAQIDAALAGDCSASEVSSLLRERRMTLNALDAMIVLVADTPADEMKAKRAARRAKLATG